MEIIAKSSYSLQIRIQLFGALVACIFLYTNLLWNICTSRRVYAIFGGCIVAGSNSTYCQQ